MDWTVAISLLLRKPVIIFFPMHFLNNFIYGHDSKVLKELTFNFFNRVFFICSSAVRVVISKYLAILNTKQCQDRDIDQSIAVKCWAGHYYQYHSCTCWTGLLSVCQPNWQQFILICRAIIKTPPATLIYLYYSYYSLD